VAVTKQGDGFEAELFDPSGHRVIRARRVIDTTSTRMTKPAQSLQIPKRINALLHCSTADATAVAPRLDEAEYRLEPGRFVSEAYVSIPAAPQDDWAAAREKLHAFWANRPEALQAWTLATVADQFDRLPPRGPHELEPGWTWLPSAAYTNPLAAMDEALEVIGKERTHS